MVRSGIHLSGDDDGDGPAVVLLHGLVGWPPGLRQAVKTVFARNRAEALLAALDGILDMAGLTPRLGERSVPTLAFVGERDAHFRELAAHYEAA